MDDLQHLTRRVTRSMHQRLNLQVQTTMEELEEEQEPLEFKHGNKHCMYLCIEREKARNQTATLSLERELALKPERASEVGHSLPLSRSSESSRSSERIAA